MATTYPGKYSGYGSTNRAPARVYSQGPKRVYSAAPRPANDNVPRAANRNVKAPKGLAKLLPKVLGRLTPLAMPVAVAADVIEGIEFLYTPGPYGLVPMPSTPVKAPVGYTADFDRVHTGTAPPHNTYDPSKQHWRTATVPTWGANDPGNPGPVSETGSGPEDVGVPFPQSSVGKWILLDEYHHENALSGVMDWWYHRARWYRTDLSTDFRPAYWPGHWIAPFPVASPAIVEALEPVTAPRPVADPVVYRRPPPPGTSESKWALTINGTPVGIAFNVFTEGMDVVNAFYFALPEWARHKGFANPYDKVVAVGAFLNKTAPKALADYFRNPDDPSLGESYMSKVAANLFRNQLIDLGIGRVGRLTAKANKRTAYGAGYQFGPAL